jgi:hypothetical protein
MNEKLQEDRLIIERPRGFGQHLATLMNWRVLDHAATIHINKSR